jgi:TFIIF-interacting CTD phosphatase-like protein
MKKLIILDLDNTLIFGTVNHKLRAEVLFHFSKILVIYERPYAKEFVTKCKEVGDVVVFTTAVREYAEQVCEHLGINPIELFTREDCLVIEDRYYKSVPDYFFDFYDDITIIDDFPGIWDTQSHLKCRMIKVKEFVGDVSYTELKKIIAENL